MEDQQQEIVNLVTQQNNSVSAAQQLLALPHDKPASFFPPIFTSINGLQRINLFKALMASHTLQPPDDNGLMLKFFTCLRPSEHGVVLEDMEVEQIDIMLKQMDEDQKVALYELLPYHVVEKIVPIMTVLPLFYFLLSPFSLFCLISFNVFSLHILKYYLIITFMSLLLFIKCILFILSLGE